MFYGLGNLLVSNDIVREFFKEIMFFSRSLLMFTRNDMDKRREMIFVFLLNVGLS